MGTSRPNFHPEYHRHSEFDKNIVSSREQMVLRHYSGTVCSIDWRLPDNSAMGRASLDDFKHPISLSTSAWSLLPGYMLRNSRIAGNSRRA